MYCTIVYIVQRWKANSHSHFPCTIIFEFQINVSGFGVRTLDILLTLKVACSIFLVAGKFKLHNMSLPWWYVVIAWIPGGSKYKKIKTEIEIKSKTKLKFNTVLGNTLTFILFMHHNNSLAKCEMCICDNYFLVFFFFKLLDLFWKQKYFNKYFIL